MLFFVVFLSSVFGLMGSFPNQTYHYQIKTFPVSDRTEFEIALRFQNPNTEPINVKMPSDCYGTPNLSRYVKTFSGENGTVVENGENESSRKVIPNKEGLINLRYTLSFDPGEMDKYAFSPNTSTSHFHLAMCQWMLPIGDTNQKHRYVFEIQNVPNNWEYYSSIAESPTRTEIVESYENLTTASIGGGEKSGVKRFWVRGKPVIMFVHGEFQIPKAKIFEAIQRIVKFQRTWMNDYRQPFYVTAIRPRSGVVAGTAPLNYLVCFIKPDTTPEKLNSIIAHEMFHHWLPGKINIKLEKGEQDFRHEWFSEGVNEYLARKVLADSKLISHKQLVEFFNYDIQSIADNPFGKASYQNLVTAANEGRFETAAKKLAYFRGALIALNWETKLRRKNFNEVKDVLKNLILFASKSNGEITEQQFFEFMAKQGVDAKGDFEKYILQGKPIEVLEDSFGKNFTLEEKDVPSFDLGFNLQETFKVRKIINVLKDGSAYQAGLRDGMEFVRIRNSSRFSNNWSSEIPVSVTIKENSVERVIEYFPNGKGHRLLLFRGVN